jgi:hypothetical protein
MSGIITEGICDRCGERDRRLCDCTVVSPSASTFNGYRPEHALHRRHSLRCICGYDAKDARDLDEHVDAMVRAS